MKILLINNLYSPYFVGGAEKAVQLVAEGLLEFGLEPIVVCSAPVPSIKKINGIKIYYLYPTNIYWTLGKSRHNFILRGLWHLLDMYNPGTYHKINKIIKEEQPQLVQTINLAGFSVSAWKAAKKAGLPLIHNLQDHYLLCPKSTMFKNNCNCAKSCWPCSFYSFPKKALSSLVDAVVGISSFILEKHCEAGYFPDSIKKVIYNPVLPRAQKEKSFLATPIRFGYLGRIVPDKGVETLLEAFRVFDPQDGTLKLGGTGESSYVDFLRRRYDAPNIAFLGFVSPDDFFKQIDILIVPSLWQEPFGMVVVEAFSHGIPVIGSNRGGITELIDDGKTGFLFEPTEPDALARIVNYFLTNRSIYPAMSSRCWAKSKEFLLTDVCAKYVDLYYELTNK